MITTRNIINLYISNLDSATTLVNSGVATVLTDGQIAIVDNSNTILNTAVYTTPALLLAAGYKTVRIAINEGGTLRLTDHINVANLLTVNAKQYKAAVEKVTCIGYDGVSATANIQSLAGNSYYLSIKDLSTTKFNQDFPLYHYAEYDTNVSTATSQDVASGLISQLIASYTEQPSNDRFIKFERLSNGTFGTSVAACTFTYGSKTVSGTGIGTAVAAVGVNTPLKVNATTATTPVYLGTYVDADTIILDVPYQGTTGSYAAKVQTVSPTLWGIRLTGIPRIFGVGKYQYDKADWEIQLKGFGTTTVTNTTALVFGSGTYEQVAEMEWDLFGNETNQLRADSPQIDVRKTALSTCTYDITVIRWYEMDNQKIIEHDPRMYKTIILATNTAAATQAVVLGTPGGPEAGLPNTVPGTHGGAEAGLLLTFGGIFYAA